MMTRTDRRIASTIAAMTAVLALVTGCGSEGDSAPVSPPSATQSPTAQSPGGRIAPSPTTQPTTPAGTSENLPTRCAKPTAPGGDPNWQPCPSSGHVAQL